MLPLEIMCNQAFQQDFSEAFRAIIPKEDAEKSSGNMHNPKLFPLREHLREAFMSTNLAKVLSQDLAKHGWGISKVGSEKFTYEKRGEGRMFGGIIYLHMEPIGQSGAGEPGEEQGKP
jgi:hypothetical protein